MSMIKSSAVGGMVTGCEPISWRMATLVKWHGVITWQLFIIEPLAGNGELTCFP